MPDTMVKGELLPCLYRTIADSPLLRTAGAEVKTIAAVTENNCLSSSDVMDASHAGTRSQRLH